MNKLFIYLLSISLVITGVYILNTSTPERLQSGTWPWSNDGDVIMIPKDKTKINIAVILFQGAQIKPITYQPVLQNIQDMASSKYSLWAAAPEFPLDMADPLVLDGGYKRVLQTLQKAGMPANTLLFLAGHSLGGSMSPSFAVGKNFTGVLQYGSYILRNMRDNYTVPTLQLGGELDGLTTIMRMAESFYHAIYFPKFDPNNFPVVVIKGLTHMQFASGTPPSLVKDRDLKPEITYDAAHQRIAEASYYFIDQMASKKLNTNLQQLVKDTETLVHPLIQAMQMEGSYHLKPPCYDNPPSPQCQVFCPWNQLYAQTIMSGLKNNGTTIDDHNEFHPVDQVLPTVHLPKIYNNCTKPEGCVLRTYTVTEAVYTLTDKMDVSDYASADELRTKMSSRQRSQIKAGKLDADFNITDAPDICAEINNQSLYWARSNIAKATLDRFDKFGQQYTFGKDLGPYNAGPLWIWTPMKYEVVLNDQKQKVISIQSPMMKTPEVYVVPAASGFHYCKVLSPARAMEWMHVQGLREHMGIKNGE